MSNIVTAGAADPNARSVEEQLQHRARLEAAAAILIWEPDSAFTPSSLADTLFAASLKIPYVVACREFSTATEAMLCYWGATVVLLGVETEDEAKRLAEVCVSHNPKKARLVPSWALAGLLQLAESPIEARLAVHLACSFGTKTAIFAQHEVATPNGNYRLDFAVDPDGSKIAIECDGHEFHERTKEQAARDKSRDRALQAAGWRVLRFTGSEIFADPGKCASEVRAIVVADRPATEGSL